MLPNNNSYYNPYLNRYPDYTGAYRPNQVNSNLQPLQPFNEVQPMLSVQCGTVNSKEDMDSIQPQLNVIYVGINKSKNEIYTKQLNNNGLIDSYIYSQTSNEISKDNNQSILECLERIESKLSKEVHNERISTTVSATSYESKAPTDADLWDVPTNDAR